MTSLLELREKLKLFYSKNDVFVVPVIKFVLAFIALLTVNGQLGYMTQIDNISVVLIIALMCSFLPWGSIAFFAMLFSLLHMYSLAIEVAVVGLCVYLLMMLLFLRFSAKTSTVVLVTMLLCFMKIPYVMPVVMGLISGPASAVGVVAGVVAYYLIMAVSNNASTIGTMASTEATAKLRLIIDSLMNNKEMLIMIVAFVITIFVVYIIRKMSMDHSWTIAIVAGVIANLVILLIGDLMYDTNSPLLMAVLGEIVAVLVAKVVQFFRFCVDYNRTEKVQFEDDEYYYYVKAVPKMTVATQTKTVKTINTQMRSSTTSGRTVERSMGNQRAVTTERTPVRRTGAQGSMRGQTSSYRNDYMNNGRSVTINSRMTQGNSNNIEDDYEELF